MTAIKLFSDAANEILKINLAVKCHREMSPRSIEGTYCRLLVKINEFHVKGRELFANRLYSFSKYEMMSKVRGRSLFLQLKREEINFRIFFAG